MEIITSEPTARLSLSVENEKSSETLLTIRTDNWQTVDVVKDAHLTESHANDALTDEELRQLALVLHGGDRRVNIVREVHAFFDRTGATVIRVSARRPGQTHALTAAYEVVRRNGGVLQTSPLIGLATSVANGEDALGDVEDIAGQRSPTDKEIDERVDNNDEQLSLPRSTWRPPGSGRVG